MTKIIRGNFGKPRGTSGWARYEAQEPGDGGEPDIKRPPPNQDLPDSGDDRPEIPDGPNTPPFTGEDVEDVGKPPKPHKRDRRTPM